MKWKFRKWADKFGLWLVSVKPVRWFFDRLFRFGEWAKEKPFWIWYCKLKKPFWIGLGLYAVILAAWKHDIIGIVVNTAILIFWLILPDSGNRPDNDDDDEPDDPDPTPNGDAIDRWLREQQKVK